MILNIFRKRNLLRNMRMQISNLQFDVNINREQIDKLKAEIYKLKPQEPEPKLVPVMEKSKNIFKTCKYCNETFITESNSLRKYCYKRNDILDYCKNSYHSENKNKLKNFLNNNNV